MTLQTSPLLRRAALALALQLGLVAALADSLPAQIPLGTQNAKVIPNILMVFDDSASMFGNFIYNTSNSTLWGSSVAQSGMGVSPTWSQAQYAHCSPQINDLYYDPTMRYYPAQSSAGVNQGVTTYAYDDRDGIFKTYTPSPTFGNVGLYSDSRGRDVVIDNICLDGSARPLIYNYKGGGLSFANSANYNIVTLQPSTTSYTKAAGRTDCTGTSCTYAQELANFSTWYQYHSTRIKMLKTALSQSMDSYDSTFRLGWGIMSQLAYKRRVDAGVSLYTGNTKTAFYNYLSNLDADTTWTVGTPTQWAIDNAGKYFKRTDGDGPWGTNPDATSTGVSTDTSPSSSEAVSAMLSCRRSATMLVTDGFWNKGKKEDDYSGVGNVDGTQGTAISGPNNPNYQYNAPRPFTDTSSNTLADIAMKYWSQDLMTGMTNNVPSANGDPAFWQHMNFHAITLGVSGTLDQNATSPTVLSQLTSGSTNWPTPSGNTISTIDDIWHATINSYGSMINANNAAALGVALNAVVQKASATATTRAAVALSSAELKVGTRKYAPSYIPGDWTGNLVATELDTNTTTLGSASTVTWRVETVGSTGEVTNTLGNFATRNIVVGTNGSPKAVNFLVGSMPASVTTTLGTSSQTMIDYLRGSRVNEGVGGIYRTRNLLMGDIVNSVPLYVPGPTRNGDGAVFVGANDGMLHGFNESNGAEVFAYIPYAVLPNLTKLADKSYSHQYFVDGPMAVTSVASGSGTVSYLVGTAGAGAKTVFALDVSTPQSMTASSLKWEIHSGTAGFSQLGYVMSAVAIGKSAVGDMIAVFGNGAYSASQNAKLYVVNLTDGALLKTFEPDNTISNNGMGGVTLVTNAYGTVIGAYAGDLKGNVWKFDMSKSTYAAWSVGVKNAKPLFTAKDSSNVVQPITAAPYTYIPSSGGRIVAVGTGKFYDDADFTSTQTQSVYGLWDAADFGASPDSDPITSTSTLVLQTVSVVATTTVQVTSIDSTTKQVTEAYFAVSANPVQLSGTVRGWYFNLNYKPGQRVILPLSNAGASQFLKMDSMIPGSVGDPCSPAVNGTGVTLVVDMNTGGTPLGASMDTNHNGAFDAGDIQGVSGYTVTTQSGTAVLDKSKLSNAQNALILALTDSTNVHETLKIDLCKAMGTGCPLTAPLKRDWRQLYMR